MLAIFNESNTAWNVKYYDKGDTCLVSKKYFGEIRGRNVKKRVSFLVNNDAINNTLRLTTAITDSIKLPEVDTGIYYSFKSYGVVVGDVRKDSVDIIALTMSTKGRVVRNITGGTIYNGYYIHNDEITFVAGIPQGGHIELTYLDKETKRDVTKCYDMTGCYSTTECPADEGLYKHFKMSNYRDLNITKTIICFKDDKELCEKMLGKRVGNHNIRYISKNAKAKNVNSDLLGDGVTAVTIFIPKGKEEDKKYKHIVDGLRTFVRDVVFTVVYDDEISRYNVNQICVK